MIGDNAVRRHATGFFGAGVKTMHEITPLEGIVQRAGDKAEHHLLDRLRQSGRANLIERAVAAARQADVAVIIAG